MKTNNPSPSVGKDRQKSQNWGRKQASRDTSREHDKTESEEFRTAVAAAAFAVDSIENKEEEIKQVPRSKSRKTLSEIIEESPRPESIGDLPSGANRPTPAKVTSQVEDKVSRKSFGSAGSIEEMPGSVEDKQLDEEPGQKEPERKLGEADIWEKNEMEKIKERFVKLKAKISEWETKKKASAKKKLTRKEGKLEWKRAQALMRFTENMVTIEKIAGKISNPRFLCC
nr:hypothetical protein [Tanacetum cinerariifolium]